MFLAMYFVANMGMGFVRYEDRSRRRFVLEARSEIHGAADHRVVHSIGAAKIANGAVVGMNTDAAA